MTIKLISELDPQIVKALEWEFEGEYLYLDDCRIKKVSDTEVDIQRKVLWGWKIIKDNSFNPKYDDKPETGREFRDYQGGKFRYRLRDDDRNIYYYLLSDIDPNKGTESQLFAPLDWAMSYAGCTMIEYKDPETGEYKFL